jgi:hypothetical protein
MKAWLNVFKVGIGQLFFKFWAPVAVLFLDDDEKVSHPIWGNSSGYVSYWDIAFRNSAHNYNTRPAQPYTQKGNVQRVPEGAPDPMEESGFKYRLRKSADREYVSLRLTFGKARPEGKREFYIGWTMDINDPTFSITFFQLRVF